MDQETKLLGPGQRERHKLKYRSTVCRNCYHPLDISDQFCPNCSQLNCTKKLAFNDFFNEFFAGIFAYDSRLYRTLGILLFKPGKISKDYIEGKRVRYANPYRFYLSASIIFFLLWSITHDTENPVDFPETTEASAVADSVLTRERAENPEIEIVLPGINGSVTRDEYIAEKDLDTMSLLEANIHKGKLFFDFHQSSGIRNADVALDSLNYRNNNYNHWLYRKAVDAEQFREDPGIFYSYFLGKLPFIIFFYLPVFALFIWLLYLRRPFTYMEHLIFTFHNQTTWFVLFGIAINLDEILQTSFLTVLATLVFSFYLYKAFRRFYGQGRVKTILKFIIINIIFFILAMFATLFSLIASFAMY